MNEFLNMWKNYINFSDRTTVRGFWMAVLFNMIAGFIVVFIAGLIHFTSLASLYSLAIFIPSLALAVRRLRDCGKTWKYMFINFIPVVGTILYIITLCKPSLPYDGVPTV